MITLISGTNRPDSNTRAIVSLYASMLEARQQPYQILDLVDLPADFTNNALYSYTGKNEEFNKLSAFISNADKFIFIVPEYNGSFPGVLKSFIDGLAYPFTFKGKKAALVGLSSGMQGGLLALSHLTDIFNYLGMHVLAQKMKFAHISKNFNGKEVTNEFYRQLMEEQVEAFLNF
ncbi:NADPH-dependent FMN reductase [Pontibacter sp. SGAir0037]|uniref:NADPH-dependent FMN reductase n=1 Tax=Pontibacter sp. SGAir0037 TaxID=2571030 RepID=UPI0010CD1606|nr:NAD(P)H-dependent oxidoreductase [Pontibacter sp. SGAir0037]QCR22898.1 NADPH-dependent FMN reductase [Pontibacter sp. SGAir0037]